MPRAATTFPDRQPIPVGLHSLRERPSSALLERRSGRGGTAETVAAVVARAERAADRQATLPHSSGRFGPWADVVDPDELVEQPGHADRATTPSFSHRHRRIGTATRAILLRTARV